MKQSDTDPVAKRFYEPPKMSTINLRPEEAILGNCKISGTSGPNAGGSCVAVLLCKFIGS